VVVGGAWDELVDERLGSGAVSGRLRQLDERLQRRCHRQLPVCGHVELRCDVDSKAGAPSRFAVGERDVDERRQ
jgi:hypothetical protein